MWAIASAVVFDRNDQTDAERDLLVLAKFIVHIRIVALLYAVSFQNRR